MMTAAVALATVLAVATAACQQRKDRSDRLEGVPTVERRLETRHTPVSDLVIVLPEAVSNVEWEPKARFDNFFITDPSDFGEVQQGLMVVNVSPRPYMSIPDSIDTEDFTGTIAGHDVTWREYTVVKPDGSQFFQREMVMRQLFEGYGTGDAPLLLHVFVGGSSYELVERLTAAAETIRFVSEPDV